MIARLQRQVEEQQRVITQFTVSNNCSAKKGNMEAQPKRDPPIAQRKPLLIIWKKARPADFDGLIDPLVA